MKKSENTQMNKSIKKDENKERVQPDSKDWIRDLQILQPKHIHRPSEQVLYYSRIIIFLLKEVIYGPTTLNKDYNKISRSILLLWHFIRDFRRWNYLFPEGGAMVLLKTTCLISWLMRKINGTGTFQGHTGFLWK